MAAKPPVIKWSGQAIIAATTTKRKLSRPDFVRVQEAWAVIDEDFDKLLTAYKRAMSKMRGQKPTLKEWNVPTTVLNGVGSGVGERMMQMKYMSRYCKVLFLFDHTTIV